MILFFINALAGGLAVKAVLPACLAVMFLARSYLSPLQSPGIFDGG